MGLHNFDRNGFLAEQKCKFISSLHKMDASGSTELQTESLYTKINIKLVPMKWNSQHGNVCSRFIFCCPYNTHK